MPNQSISVVGSNDFSPTEEQIRRVQDFYQWSGYKKLSNMIVVVSPKDFQNVVNQVSRKPSDTAVTVPSIGRTYINSSLFDSKARTGRDNLEWTLAHEAEHLNSPESYIASEMDDKLMDEKADHLMKQWNGPEGQGYRRVVGIQRKIAQESEPIHIPMDNRLIPPVGR